ncbi:hypothetical protein HK098_001054 [Nowakowskiella sp. JEL0407]|nr:hypothetical protein HK098_001054 [Nowakowskiella sp. JEL0407]
MRRAEPALGTSDVATGVSASDFTPLKGGFGGVNLASSSPLLETTQRLRGRQSNCLTQCTATKCAPIYNAVCCSDGQTYCPSGSVCESGGTCFRSCSSGYKRCGNDDGVHYCSAGYTCDLVNQKCIITCSSSETRCNNLCIPKGNACCGTYYCPISGDTCGSGYLECIKPCSTSRCVVCHPVLLVAARPLNIVYRAPPVILQVTTVTEIALRRKKFVVQDLIKGGCIPSSGVCCGSLGRYCPSGTTCTSSQYQCQTSGGGSGSSGTGANGSGSGTSPSPIADTSPVASNGCGSGKKSCGSGCIDESATCCDSSGRYCASGYKCDLTNNKCVSTTSSDVCQVEMYAVLTQVIIVLLETNALLTVIAHVVEAMKHLAEALVCHLDPFVAINAYCPSGSTCPSSILGFCLGGSAGLPSPSPSPLPVSVDVQSSSTTTTTTTTSTTSTSTATGTADPKICTATLLGLELESPTSIPDGDTTAVSIASDSSGNSSGGGIGAGAIVAIVLVALACVGAAVWFFIYRRRNQAKSTTGTVPASATRSMSFGSGTENSAVSQPFFTNATTYTPFVNQTAAPVNQPMMSPVTSPGDPYRDSYLAGYGTPYSPATNTTNAGAHPH